MIVNSLEAYTTNNKLLVKTKETKKQKNNWKRSYD